MAPTSREKKDWTGLGDLVLKMDQEVIPWLGLFNPWTDDNGPNEGKVYVVAVVQEMMYIFNLDASDLQTVAWITYRILEMCKETGNDITFCEGGDSSAYTTALQEMEPKRKIRFDYPGTFNEA